MPFAPIFGRVLLPGLILAAGLCGCASPGVPKPPSLRLPAKAANLQAERVAGEVRLTWTTSADTTDGDAIRGGISAALCRRQGKGACVPVRQISVLPGPSAITDSLPATLRVGADSVISYQVDLKNDRGHSAGASEPAFAAAGRAPETPAGVAAKSRRDGVLLTWQPEAGGAPGATVEVQRTGPDQKPAAPVKAAGRKGTFAGPQKPTDGKLTLVAEGANSASGMVDRAVKSGETYTYVAERVRHVQLGGHALELHSAAAPALTIAYRDTFPPVAPVGLATIPGGGLGGEPSIDLSWEPNSEPDLAGYRVYRAVDGGPSALLTPTLVANAAFRDLKVARGHTYLYRVTAVDAQGNESPQSAAAREVLR